MPIPPLAVIPTVELLTVTLAGAMAALISDDARMRCAFAGTLGLGLAVASTRVLGGASPALAVSAGIALAGIALLMVAAGRDLRESAATSRHRVALGIAAVALLCCTAWLFRGGVAAGAGALLGTTAGILVAGTVLFRLLALAPALRWGTRRATSESAVSITGALRWRGAHVVATLGLLVAPQLHLFLLLLTISLVAGVEFVRRREGARWWPLSALLALPVLLFAWYLLARVAGEQSLAMPALPDAPYSEAFQLGMALALGLLAWSLLRLWPFQRHSRGPLAPLAGAALMARVVAPALPDGLAHWQPLLYLLVLLAALHALLSRRVESGPALLAALALASGEPAAVGVGYAFAALASAPEVQELLAGGRRALNASGKVLGRLLLVAGAALLVPALAAALSTQVVYTVAAIATLALAVALSAAPAPRTR